MAGPLTDTFALTELALAAGSASGRLSLVLATADPLGEFASRLDLVARQVEDATDGAVAVRRTRSTKAESQPYLAIRAREREPIRYQAIPEGPEEAPFLAALRLLLEPARDGAGPIDLPCLESPAEIQVFIAPGCPHCPVAVSAANTLAATSDMVSVQVVDVKKFAARAEAFNVRSAPTIVIDGELTLVGVKSQQELVSILRERNGPGRDLAVFRSLIDAGRLEAAAAMLLDGRGLEPFAELWTRSGLEARIGLTLAAQQSLDEMGSSLDDLVPMLLGSLQSPDAALRGDTADMLGQIGHRGARTALRALLHDPNSDVAETAADALEQLDVKST